MIFNQTPLSDTFVIELEKKEDERGFFSRYFCKNEFKQYGLVTEWPQMNVSYNIKRGTLRGMHFQKYPKDVAKVVRCIKGSIWDVVVDLRKGSKTYGKWFGKELNDQNRFMMYVPKGFAHGYQTLNDDTELLYLHSDFYYQQYDAGINYNCHSLKIDWPLSINEISKKDLSLPKLSEIDPPFG
tara:strand:+ start:69 stop:617 length:549 start_codon:yes stop_codon:yes gene_type:complete